MNCYYWWLCFLVFNINHCLPKKKKIKILQWKPINKRCPIYEKSTKIWFWRLFLRERERGRESCAVWLRGMSQLKYGFQSIENGNKSSLASLMQMDRLLCVTWKKTWVEFMAGTLHSPTNLKRHDIKDLLLYKIRWLVVPH